MDKDKKGTSTEPKLETTTAPIEQEYIVLIAGGFKIPVTAHNEEFAKGLALGTLRAKKTEPVAKQNKLSPRVNYSR